MDEVRTAMTTGANSGIGLATVLDLARRGFRSVATVRSEAKAAVVTEAARASKLTVETVVLDIADPESCTRVIDDYRPYALVNNAGVSAIGAVEDVTDAEAWAAMETMAIAPMRLARLAIPHMRARGGGRIVNVSSIYGRVSTPLTGWYQGAKHALEGLTDALRMEVTSDAIRVVLVEPGGFRTGIWQDAEREIAGRAGSRYDRAYRRTLTTTRIWRPFMGHPERCARLIGSVVADRRPRARYLVGPDAHAFALMHALAPTRVEDRVLRFLMSV